MPVVASAAAAGLREDASSRFSFLPPAGVDELFLLLGRFLVAGIVVVLVGGGVVLGVVLLVSIEFILDCKLQKAKQPDAALRPCPLLTLAGPA